MPDNIDAVNPDHIGPEWDGQIVVPISVLANPDAWLFDSEAGDAGVDAVAQAASKRVRAFSWAGVYVNQDREPSQTAALRNVGLYWSQADMWPAPGVYLWAADPDIAPGLVPAWCPVRPIMVQNRWQQTIDLSSVFGPYVGRVVGYLDGPESVWPPNAWDRFVMYQPGVNPGPLNPPGPDPNTGEVHMKVAQFGKDGQPGSGMRLVRESGIPVAIDPDDLAAWLRFCGQSEPEGPFTLPEWQAFA